MVSIDGSPARLWCLRHAESIDNVAGVLSAAVPGADLTDLGRRQARAAADTLADESLVAVYASPATRTQRTAAAIAQRCGAELRTRADLVEWQLGEYEGRADAEARQRCGQVAHAWIVDRELDAGLPGGDTGHDVVRRCVGALTEIAADHPGQAVAVVSHGAALAMALLAVCPQFATTAWGRPLSHARPFLLSYAGAAFSCEVWPGEPVGDGLFHTDLSR